MADLVVEKVTHDGVDPVNLAHGYDADSREPGFRLLTDDEAERLIAELQHPEFIDGPGGIRVPVLPRLVR